MSARRGGIDFLNATVTPAYLRSPPLDRTDAQAGDAGSIPPRASGSRRGKSVATEDSELDPATALLQEARAHLFANVARRESTLSEMHLYFPRRFSASQEMETIHGMGRRNPIDTYLSQPLVEKEEPLLNAYPLFDRRLPFSPVLVIVR